MPSVPINRREERTALILLVVQVARQESPARELADVGALGCEGAVSRRPERPRLADTLSVSGTTPSHNRTGE